MTTLAGLFCSAKFPLPIEGDRMRDKCKALDRAVTRLLRALKVGSTANRQAAVATFGPQDMLGRHNAR